MMSIRFSITWKYAVRECKISTDHKNVFGNFARAMNIVMWGVFDSLVGVVESSVG